MQTIRQTLHREWLALKKFNASNINWTLAITAASVIVAPLLIGLALQQLNTAMVVAMGSMVFLYLPQKPLPQRLNIIILVAFGMQAALVFGLLVPPAHWSLAPAMALVVFLSLWLARAFQLNIPGALYFIITAGVAFFLPLPLAAIPQLLGLFALGNLWAISMALLYSIVAGSESGHTSASNRTCDFRQPLGEALLIAAIMAATMLLAVSLQLQRPYWVPICCMSVLQMPSTTLAWQRLWQMIASSSIGLLLVWLLFLLPINNWIMAIVLWFVLIMTLWLLLRHYFLAMIFITPMTIFFVEFSVSATLPSGELILTRWIDILLGVGCGIAGHFFLHSHFATHFKRRFYSPASEDD